MTATVDHPITQDPEQPVEIAEPTPELRALWGARAVALIVDVVPGGAVLVAAALVAPALPLHSAWWWAVVSVAGIGLLSTLTNRVVLPATAHRSPGRRLAGTTVVRGDGEAPGLGRLSLRETAHLLDTAAVFVGWLWPLWDHRARTFADILAGTEVSRVSGERWSPAAARPAALAFLVAALACTGVAAVGYVAVYQRERASMAAGAEIGAQGPKMIEEMLSYTPESLQGDFARARSLATEKYREILVPQQQAIAERKPVVANEYWANNNAVLSAAPNRATMLTFLQGQRGEAGKERLITATVRVTFVKAKSEWRVDDLVVLTKPPPAEAGR